MTRTYEVKTRVNNLDFELRYLEDGIETGTGSFPTQNGDTEAEAFDDAMVHAEEWVVVGRRFNVPSEQERSQRRRSGG
jgi:hypothetical protein